MQIIVVAIAIAVCLVIVIIVGRSGLRYLRPKFAINEVAWLSGRLERSSDGI